jgi:hypothetical protein
MGPVLAAFAAALRWGKALTTRVNLISKGQEKTPLASIASKGYKMQPVHLLQIRLRNHRISLNLICEQYLISK